ncbi:hypothetical protein ABW21_db0200331 [Orbilia brochopaga]|nr:hypothetical protein ABW21_db0200331 [Drechslerella brochopaga]
MQFSVVALLMAASAAMATPFAWPPSDCKVVQKWQGQRDFSPVKTEYAATTTVFYGRDCKAQGCEPTPMFWGIGPVKTATTTVAATLTVTEVHCMPTGN